MDSFPATLVLKTPKARGFTLVEMLVVLAIIVVITAVVITGQTSYNRSLVLTDTAYTVAYSVRQAQSLGLASRGVSSLSNAGYGVRFTGPSGNGYLVFGDTGGTNTLSASVCPVGTAGTPDAKPGNCKYDAGTDSIVQTYSLSRGYTIQGLCGKVSAGGTCTPVTSLDVVFMRPETRAIIIGPSNQSFVCAQLNVVAPTGGDIRTVRVSQLGEISVGQSCP